MLVICPAGFVLVDRQGKHFGTLLNFLRDGEVPFPENARECSELFHEARYYLFEELAAKLEEHISIIKKDNLTVCRLPMVTTPEEFQRVLTETRKVCMIHVWTGLTTKGDNGLTTQHII